MGFGSPVSKMRTISSPCPGSFVGRPQQKERESARCFWACFSSLQNETNLFPCLEVLSKISIKPKRGNFYVLGLTSPISTMSKHSLKYLPHVWSFSLGFSIKLKEANSHVLSPAFCFYKVETRLKIKDLSIACLEFSPRS